MLLLFHLFVYSTSLLIIYFCQIEVRQHKVQLTAFSAQSGTFSLVNEVIIRCDAGTADGGYGTSGAAGRQSESWKKKKVTAGDEGYLQTHLRGQNPKLQRARNRQSTKIEIKDKIKRQNPNKDQYSHRIY